MVNRSSVLSWSVSFSINKRCHRMSRPLRSQSQPKRHDLTRGVGSDPLRSLEPSSRAPYATSPAMASRAIQTDLGVSPINLSARYTNHSVSTFPNSTGIEYKINGYQPAGFSSHAPVLRDTSRLSRTQDPYRFEQVSSTREGSYNSSIGSSYHSTTQRDRSGGSNLYGDRKTIEDLKSSIDALEHKRDIFVDREFEALKKTDVNAAHKTISEPFDTMQIDGASYRNSGESGSMSNYSRKKLAILGPGLKGVQNLGNTCSINAVLQCLFSVPRLREYLLKKETAGDINEDSPSYGMISQNLRALCHSWYARDEEGYIDASSFLDAFNMFEPMYRASTQQDAHEFLKVLFQRLENELDKPSSHYEFDRRSQSNPIRSPEGQKAWESFLKENKSVIAREFGGMLHNEFSCTKCNHKSTSWEPFLDLSVHIPENTSHRMSKRAITIRDCLSSYVLPERISEANRVMCEKCRTKQEFQRQTSICKYPPNMIIHVNRFKNEYEHLSLSATLEKNDTWIQFPLEGLDLTGSAIFFGNEEGVADFIYDLVGVVCHTGTLIEGHYTAYCKSQLDELWYHFDDSRVYQSSPEDVKHVNAYLLFYTRQKE